MSAGGAFGGNRGVRPVPPEKGVFPLDHMHECDLEKKEYINCLKSSGHKSDKCRNFSKKYLECRMEKSSLEATSMRMTFNVNENDSDCMNLMAKQDMSELGFRKECDSETSEEKQNNGRIDN